LSAVIIAHRQACRQEFVMVGGGDVSCYGAEFWGQSQKSDQKTLKVGVRSFPA